MDGHRVIVRYEQIARALDASGSAEESTAPPSAIERMAAEIEAAVGGELESAEETAFAEPGSAPPVMGQEAMLAALSEALSLLEEEEEGRDVLTAVPDQLASLLQSHLLALGVQAGQLAPLAGDDGVPRDELEVKFDERDILGWVGSVFSWWRRIRPHKWIEAPPDPEPLPDTARVALLGDWGTGLYGAPVCARSLAADPAGYQLLVHLGDVYYSGTEDEVEDRFLKFWPKVDGAVSRAANANHEMYSGGYGYFKGILQTFDQRASYFALQNEAWLLVGLDSAYEDHALARGQGKWLARLLEKSGDRKVVLFSHHQPFSLLDKQGPKLVDRLGPFLRDGRIHAWYWGHEHRCVLYDRHPAWGLFGRCLGHGGYPHFRDRLQRFPLEHHLNGSTWRRLPTRNLVPGGLVLDAPNPHVENRASEYGANGYLTLELNGPQLRELVHDADGRLLHEQMVG
jgi:hypothetical protein